MTRGMTRAFVAIPMPEDAAARLAALARGCPVGRRVPEENLHLTLCFLGDVSDAGLEEMHEALEAIRSGPVELNFEGLGVFGDEKPRALWAGVAAAPGLVELQGRVERSARRAGLTPEARRFVPHVTLVRMKGRREDTEPLARFLATRVVAAVPPVRAVAFSLIASQLHPDGARYEELARYPMIG
jgi:RNA 2',3'-cyclic 3'-phosphodiesterase